MLFAPRPQALSGSSRTPTHPSWDERYRRRPASTEPAVLLVKFAGLLPSRGRALDVACGGGRNAVFLAHHGLRVVALDRSWPALQQGRGLAARQGRQVGWLQADMSREVFGNAAFDVILCFYYRDAGLYLLFRQWLQPGGLLFYESYTRDQLCFHSGPQNPDHLLKPGELLEAFEDWEILMLRETWQKGGVVSLVARKPAAR